MVGLCLTVQCYTAWGGERGGWAVHDGGRWNAGAAQCPWPDSAECLPGQMEQRLSRGWTAAEKWGGGFHVMYLWWRAHIRLLSI